MKHLPVLLIGLTFTACKETPTVESNSDYLKNTFGLEKGDSIPLQYVLDKLDGQNAGENLNSNTIKFELDSLKNK